MKHVAFTTVCDKVRSIQPDGGMIAPKHAVNMNK